MTRPAERLNPARDMAATTYFEALVAAEIVQLKEALVTTPAAESHRVATVQGNIIGLTKSLELFREAARRDIDPDGDGV